ncbi:SDR family NAD(P)-dependent oxidoreductase [Streptomyces sp. NPDC001275]
MGSRQDHGVGQRDARVQEGGAEDQHEAEPGLGSTPPLRRACLHHSRGIPGISASSAGRVAIVTGAGAPDGIGAAVARALVSQGARVVLGATSERVHERAAELGADAVGVVADLTVDGAAGALVRAALDRWGRIDVLVNNAVMTSVASSWDADDDIATLSPADWNAALTRNLTTAFLMCRAVVPVMGAVGCGRIVSVGSTTGTVNAMPGQATYTSAKAGLVGLSRALALEVVRDGITVNVVAPAT